MTLFQYVYFMVISVAIFFGRKSAARWSVFITKKMGEESASSKDLEWIYKGVSILMALGATFLFVSNRKT